jgi:allantoin racemase
MRIRLVNPNTTETMTETAARAARAVAAPGTIIEPVTSAMGPESVEGFYDEALAVPGLLAEIAKAEADGADAAIISCFDDTGLDAARSLAAIPVVGLCEAGTATAAFIAPRFAIITTLPRSVVPIEALVARYGMSARCRVHAADVPVLALENASSGAVEELRAAVAGMLADPQIGAIVLGCAGMADLARSLAEEFGVPVIDPVGAAVKQCEALVGLGLGTSKRGAYARPLGKRYSGILTSFAPAI